MSATFIVLIVLSSVVSIGALLALGWLWRTLQWEVVDDDELHYKVASGRSPGRNWLKSWFKPKPPMLTYRRDRLGRFRRHRR